MNVFRGGGVLLAARQPVAVYSLDLSSKGFNDLQFTDLLGVKCSLGQVSLYIFVVYIQPGACTDEFELLFDLLGNLPDLYNRRVIIVGDFNISDYDFTSSRASNCSRKSSILQNFLQFGEYQQYNNVGNINGRCLDLVISNFNCTVQKSADPMLKEDNHHPSLLITSTIRDNKLKHINTNNSQPKQWNFRKADFPSLYKSINDTDWSSLKNIHNVNTACSYLYDKINTAINSHVPKSSYRRNSNFPSWFTPVIIGKLKRKWKLLRKFRQTGNTETHDEFKRIRTEIKKDVKTAYSSYISDERDTPLAVGTFDLGGACALHLKKRAPSACRIAA
ncbi:hypothetical protein Zmor_003742 [Zophobas morio]|uniref:Endonuclease/exonuclease/phosphatase domain-containing protein n=1 Tax=Zophobas morio TaxID=2755281 RepID=A0AA38M1L6_9CUCU|nr:hypothetical protein Zmor_003742 [Zophobas morio]